MMPSPLLRPAIQILSPEICDGYAKKTNALDSSAGFQMFIPVPPNTSFPTITANATDSARIQSGTSTGIISGISIPDTRKPSLTSWPLICAAANSIPRPTTYDTIISGRTLMNPKKNISQNPIVPPIARLCWYPVFHIPKSSAGIRATITTVITLFRSMLSLIWTPFFATVSGTKRNVSNASKVEWRNSSFPPLLNVGLILSIIFLNTFIVMCIMTFL